MNRSNPPEQYVYIFVRQDIPLEHQIVQSNHAALSLASHYGVDGIPNIVLIGVPDKSALELVCERLTANQIPHWSWEEPDFDFGFTAIATAPISGQQRECLRSFRLWKPVIHPSANCKPAASKAAYVGAGPTG